MVLASVTVSLMICVTVAVVALADWA